MSGGLNLEEAVKVAEHTARAAGKILLKMQNGIHAKEKAPKDLVTEADVASQRLIFDRLSAAFPDYSLLGEEELEVETVKENDDGFCWIVDPLDGTTNYVHGMEDYCVSIGLRQGSETVAGVIYDPNRDHVYTAIRGGGAFRNGEKLSTSRVRSLREALVVSSFSARVERDSPEIARFIEVLLACQALRRLGSAALNMCYLASGKMDGYWATSVKAWDVAAGLLIIEEAGGTVTSLAGDRSIDLAQPHFVAAANDELHAELLELLQMATESRSCR